MQRSMWKTVDEERILATRIALDLQYRFGNEMSRVGKTNFLTIASVAATHPLQNLRLRF